MSSDPVSKMPPFKNSDAAPVVYFDIVPVFGVLNGVIQIELAGRTLSPAENDGVTIEFVSSGRLRCSPAAAEFLRNALDKALEMVRRPDAAPTPAAATGRMN